MTVERVAAEIVFADARDVRRAARNRTACSAVFVVLVAICGFACSGPIEVTARSPKPNIMPHARLAGSYSLDLSGVPEARTCYPAPGLKDLCVARLRPAFDAGLRQVLDGDIRPDPAGRYSARFAIVEIAQSAVSVGKTDTVSLSLRWQFVLADARGEPLVQLAETTVGPKNRTTYFGADEAVDALIDATLERIAKALDEVHVAPGREDAPSSTAL